MTAFTLALLLAAPPTDATLRARAALALAFADPPTYAERYALAARTGRPLIVWVGQSPRAVTGCVCIGCPAFEGAIGGVVVGVPTGDRLRRIDLPGTPTDDAIAAAIRTGGGPTPLPVPR